MRISQTLALAAVLAAGLLAPSTALADDDDHDGHDPTATCGWQADALPVFPPGETAVFDTGLALRTSILGELVGIEEWSIVVLPGYHVGFVEAYDHGIPLQSDVVKAYARTSVYGVYKTNDCCGPERRAKATMSCGFAVRAAVPNSPGSAAAQGVTYIVAANTQVSLTAAAAVTTDAGDDGTEVELDFPGPGGTTAKVKFKIDFDSEDESVDEVSRVSAGPSLPAPDEEYYISTDLNLEAHANGAPWDRGKAVADLYGHRVTLQTHVSCGHCGAVGNDLLFVDGSTYGTE